MGDDELIMIRDSKTVLEVVQRWCPSGHRRSDGGADLVEQQLDRS